MRKGTYILLIEIPKNTVFSVGKLGDIHVEKGVLLYVGSGMNGIEQRLRRHFAHAKKRYWHIDYVTALYPPKLAFFVESINKLEDAVASILCDYPGVKPINNFGASDSKLNTHLFWVPNLESAIKISHNALSHASGKPPHIFPHFSDVQQYNLKYISQTPKNCGHNNYSP